MTAAVTQLKQALMQLVAGMAMVPTTTLAAPTTAGGSTIPLATATGFVPGGLVRYLDGTAERVAVIDTLTGTTAHMDTTLSGGSLLYGHAMGAQVAANLTPAMPVEVSPMFASGFPVISVNALDRTRRAETNGLVTPRYVVNLCHLLPLNQAQSSLHTQVWTEKLTAQAEHDVEAIQDALQSNYTVQVGGVSYATWIERFAASSRGNAQDYDVPVWETWLDVWIRGDDVLI